MGFSRQEYGSGLPFLAPGDLPDPGIEPTSPALQVISLLSEPSGKLPKIVKGFNKWNAGVYLKRVGNVLASGKEKRQE